MARVALQLHVAVVAGTRAEAFKLAPLIASLRRRPGLQTTLILSGEAQLGDETGAALGADFALDAPADAAFATLLPRIAPDLLLVIGDSDTAWTAAHVANRLGIAIAHLEAGLRSGHLDLPWPAERNRTEIDSMAALLLTPCARATRAVAGLPGQISETGSITVDAVRAAVVGSEARPVRSTPVRLLAATRHNLPELPLHSGCSITRLSLEDPATDHAGLVRRLAAADLLLTDDATLHEAAAIIGIPALLLCATTERWDIVDGGHSRIVGTDPVRLHRAIAGLLGDPARLAAMARPCLAYGDGAAGRIADAIAYWAAQTSLFEAPHESVHERDAAGEAPSATPPALPLAPALF